MSKHTPGPWKLDIPAQKANSTTLRGANNSPIAEINKPGLRYDERNIGPIYPSEYQANASLIAAAPELLEAVKSILKLDQRKPFLMNDERALLLRAEAKAEGRS